ncbi:MAG: hypothetical protein LBE78_13035 [Burkholderiaceae bacterium]|jgi:hypothetical protein|nr:hypothetical protein [Burkholderiaceae bacterium]
MPEVHPIHTVAVWAGSYRLRVLIDDIGASAAEAQDEARAILRQALGQLIDTPADQWHTAIVASTEVEDIPSRLIHPFQPTGIHHER